MATPTKVDIANGALQRLGAKRISSLTQDAPNARSMNATFDRVLRAEMRRYAWSFAIKRASITVDADGPTWGDWNRYGLPADFVRLLRDDETGIAVDWKIEAGDTDNPRGYILSADATPLLIRYLAFIETPASYDHLFIEAVECKLAFVCCKEITGSSAAKDSLKEDYDTAIAEAKRIGFIEKEAQAETEDDWLLARL